MGIAKEWCCCYYCCCKEDDNAGLSAASAHFRDELTGVIAWECESDDENEEILETMHQHWRPAEISQNKEPPAMVKTALAHLSNNRSDSPLATAVFAQSLLTEIDGGWRLDLEQVLPADVAKAAHGKTATVDLVQLPALRVGLLVMSPECSLRHLQFQVPSAYVCVAGTVNRVLNSIEKSKDSTAQALVQHAQDLMNDVEHSAKLQLSAVVHVDAGAEHSFFTRAKEYGMLVYIRQGGPHGKAMHAGASVREMANKRAQILALLSKMKNLESMPKMVGRQTENLKHKIEIARSRASSESKYGRCCGAPRAGLYCSHCGSRFSENDLSSEQKKKQ